jgi:hypothetical protein
VQARGFPTFGHFYTAYGGFLRDADWAHQMRAAATEQGVPAGQLPLGRAVIPALAPRNIHLVVVESLTDPAWYPGFDLDVPLPPLFERWRGVDTRALSPVFGNRSSNAEFELLCGVPSMVGPSEIVFWRLPARPLPCLTRRLTGLGYRSVSLVPSAAEIFNAGLAYDAIGFERSLFDRDLDMSDLDGQFLSAESTLAPHWQARAPLIGTGPLLSYVFVTASHYPYALDQRRRPAAVQAQHAPAIMVDYANVISYAARAIDRFVARLQAGDPNGLIVILGDHAPPLGSNFLGYRKGGRIAAGERAPLRQAALYEVPLLVLDRGELLPVGRLPTYQIPYLLLDRLTEGAFCHRNGCAWDGQWGLRPFRDLILSFETHGAAARACAPASATEPCKQALEVTRAWQRELARMIGLGPVESRRTSMATPSPHGAP